jgi:hypothetical protein
MELVESMWHWQHPLLLLSLNDAVLWHLGSNSCWLARTEISTQHVWGEQLHDMCQLFFVVRARMPLDALDEKSIKHLELHPQ